MKLTRYTQKRNLIEIKTLIINNNKRYLIKEVNEK